VRQITYITGTQGIQSRLGYTLNCHRTCGEKLRPATPGAPVAIYNPTAYRLDQTNRSRGFPRLQRRTS